MDLDKAIKERRSVRKFKSKKPDWRDILLAIDSARYAPMAGGNFTPRFIVIDDPKKIEKLGEASQQPFVSQAKYILVICSNQGRTINSFKERGKNYIKQQAGAAIQNILLKLTDLGLSTTWVGHFYDKEVREILKIPENVTVEALLPIGYEYKKPSTKKVRIDMDGILYFNEYKNKRMKPTPEVIRKQK